MAARFSSTFSAPRRFFAHMEFLSPAFHPLGAELPIRLSGFVRNPMILNDRGGILLVGRQEYDSLRQRIRWLWPHDGRGCTRWPCCLSGARRRQQRHPRMPAATMHALMSCAQPCCHSTGPRTRAGAARAAEGGTVGPWAAEHDRPDARGPGSCRGLTNNSVRSGPRRRPERDQTPNSLSRLAAARTGSRLADSINGEGPMPCSKTMPSRDLTKPTSQYNPAALACPACGVRLIDIRAKLQCSQCHRICETCCEGGRG